MPCPFQPILFPQWPFLSFPRNLSNSLNLPPDHWSCPKKLLIFSSSLWFVPCVTMTIQNILPTIQLHSAHILFPQNISNLQPTMIFLASSTYLQHPNHRDSPTFSFHPSFPLLSSCVASIYILLHLMHWPYVALHILCHNTKMWLILEPFSPSSIPMDLGRLLLLRFYSFLWYSCYREKHGMWLPWSF